MDKQAILNGNYFSLDKESDVKFRLEYRNWNDDGYYTLFSLEMRLPDSTLQFRIADILVMYVGQQSGEKPTATDKTTIFISNVGSAETLFLYLTPVQRLKLEKILSIRYDCRDVENEVVFRKSVLREKTKMDFNKQQEEIKNLMHSKIDARTFLIRNKDQVNLWLSEVAK